jgi:hypothetical protein
MSIKKGLLALLTALFLAGCLPDAEVTFVKEGTLDACEQKTVGQMASDYFGGPSWESGVADDGRTYVNLTGQITFNEKPVDAAIQFLVHKSQERFEVNAFEMNGIPQNILMLNALLSNMCDA